MIIILGLIVNIIGEGLRDHIINGTIVAFITNKKFI